MPWVAKIMTQNSSSFFQLDLTSILTTDVYSVVELAEENESYAKLCQHPSLDKYWAGIREKMGWSPRPCAIPQKQPGFSDFGFVRGMALFDLAQELEEQQGSNIQKLKYLYKAASSHKNFFSSLSAKQFLL